MCTRVGYYIAAAKVNKRERANLEGLRVHGAITNLTRFSFYTYDHISDTFCQDDEILVETLRDGFSSGMVQCMSLVS